MRKMLAIVISLLFTFPLSTVAFATEAPTAVAKKDEAPKTTSPTEWSAPTSADDPKADAEKDDVKKEKTEKAVKIKLCLFYSYKYGNFDD